MTGTEDFSGFVKPHLAIGPKGDHNPDVPDSPKQIGRTNQNPFGAFFVNAAFQPAAAAENSLDENFFKPDYAKSVRLAPKQTLEIEIPVELANNFGLTLMASSEISATLADEQGVIVGKNSAKTLEANALFRSIFVDKNIVGGTWKLKFENASDRELNAILATWKNAVK